MLRSTCCLIIQVVFTNKIDIVQAPPKPLNIPKDRLSLFENWYTKAKYSIVELIFVNGIQNPCFA